MLRFALLLSLSQLATCQCCDTQWQIGTNPPAWRYLIETRNDGIRLICLAARAGQSDTLLS
jgi:hypothetical protein